MLEGRGQRKKQEIWGEGNNLFYRLFIVIKSNKWGRKDKNKIKIKILKDFKILRMMGWEGGGKGRREKA